MSLPIVVIFERHWDTIPKSVIRDLLPALNKKGYDTFCFEAPQNLSSAEIVDRHDSALELDSSIQKQAENLLRHVGIITELSDLSFSRLAELMRRYVSSKKYIEVAEKVKQLPASRILKEVFCEAKKLSMSLKGIDIGSEDFDEMMAPDVLRRMSGIRLREDQRITTMFQNLLKLRAQQEEGVIFACGALHAENLIAEFKKYGLEDEVLYYFPHSLSRCDESVDDVSDVLMNDTLLDHTYLLTQEDIKPFTKRIIREITEKIRYKGEILDYNSHREFLSEYFKANFRVFLRPGDRVDALVDVNESSDVEGIQRSLTKAGIQTHNTSLDGRSYLVIPDVNTRDVAEKVRRMFF